MGCARTDFVIAAGATIRLDSPRGGDGSHLVVVAVGPGFHPVLHRQRPERLLLTRWRAAARHDSSLVRQLRIAGTRPNPFHASRRNPMSDNGFRDQPPKSSLAA